VGGHDGFTCDPANQEEKGGPLQIGQHEIYYDVLRKSERPAFRASSKSEKAEKGSSRHQLAGWKILRERCALDPILEGNYKTTFSLVGRRGVLPGK